jgi:hypothetical protein
MPLPSLRSLSVGFQTMNPVAIRAQTQHFQQGSRLKSLRDPRLALKLGSAITAIRLTTKSPNALNILKPQRARTESKLLLPLQSH